ncbi:MAG: 3-isopropylmalate dehydrogenase [Deltaproteobacteria bacterium]|nr:3-isopropylmalate dehydrogenase [Deltaproteobacteria bacterium]
MKAKIVLLPGDGIGPEVTYAARDVLVAVAGRFGHRFEFESFDVGGVAIDAHGDPLPEATFSAARHSDAVLLGAVGGPRWEDPRIKRRPEQGLLSLRSGLQVYANLRPVKVWASLADLSPLKRERVLGVDMMVVRELTGGIYFGAPKFREALSGGGQRAVDTLEYTDGEVRRVAKMAFELARGRRHKVTSVDKANVLESSRLWRQVVNEVAVEYPGLVLEHRLVDSAAMQLIMQAETFDVIVTENMFGDILTDEAAVIAGSLGLLPSASLGDKGPGLFEPIHGSAPDIAGKGIANPIGAILSAAMLCRYGLHLPEEAQVIEAACERAVAAGARTGDLGGKATTVDVTRAVVELVGG